MVDERKEKQRKMLEKMRITEQTEKNINMLPTPFAHLLQEQQAITLPTSVNVNLH